MTGHHFIAANEVGYPVNWNEKRVELSRAEFLQAYEELAFFPSVETGDPSLENLLQQATLQFAAEQVFQYGPEPWLEFIEPVVADASRSSSATSDDLLAMIPGLLGGGEDGEGLGSESEVSSVSTEVDFGPLLVLLQPQHPQLALPAVDGQEIPPGEPPSLAAARTVAAPGALEEAGGAPSADGAGQPPSLAVTGEEPTTVAAAGAPTDGGGAGGVDYGSPPRNQVTLATSSPNSPFSRSPHPKHQKRSGPASP